MSTLPYEKVYAVDQTRGIASATPIPTLNIASVINSDTGPIEIIEVKNQAELIDNYCTGSVISATDNETIQFNGALLTKAQVDIVRADTSSMRVGKGSYTQKPLYFDKDYNLLNSITKIKLSQKSSTLDVLWVTVKNSEGVKTTYFLGGNSAPEGKEGAINLAGEDVVSVTIKNFFNLLFDKGVCLSITDTEATFIPEVVEFSDNLYIKDFNGKLYEELVGQVSKLSADYSVKTIIDSTTSLKVGPYTYYDKDSYSINKSSFTNPVELSFKSDNGFPSGVFLMLAIHDLISTNKVAEPLGISAKATLGDKVVINDINKIYELIKEAESIGGAITITDVNDDTKGPAIYYEKDSVEIVPSNINEVIKYENPSVDSFFKVTHATDETNPTYFKSETNYLVIDDQCYYSGVKTPNVPDVVSYISVSKEELSVSEFIEKAFEAMLNSYTIGRAPYNTFIFDGSHKVTVSDKIDYTISHIDQSSVKDAFAIVCKFTSSQPLFNFSYNKVTGDEYDTYELAYNFKNVSNKITFSFDGDAVNSTGSSIYYEKFNEDPDYKNNYIQIVKLSGDKDLNYYESGDFGNEVLNNPVTEAAYSEAILKFLKTKNKQYQFVTDAGHCSVELAQACKQVADEKFAQYAPSIPPTLKTVEEIKEHVSKLSLDDFRCQYLVPGHKSTYNGNFLSTVPASLSYMFARINAFQSVTGEFNPLFGVKKGTVAAPNLVTFFDDEEAQELADQNINVITKDMAGTYIRSNFTSQLINSYLSEDQNAYMTNVISQVCEKYNPEIVAELNTLETRMSVVNNLTTRLTERMISSKNPTITKFRVVCDESLNTQAVIEARQLIYQVWVQYSPSVAYVLAYVHVKRLGSF